METSEAYALLLGLTKLESNRGRYDQVAALMRRAGALRRADPDLTHQVDPSILEDVDTARVRRAYPYLRPFSQVTV